MRTELAIQPRTFDAVGVGVTLAMLVVTAWLVAVPLHGERRDLADEADGHRVFLATASEVDRQHRETVSRHSAQLERVATLTARVPATPNESAFLGQLSALARQSGLVLQEFEPAEALDRGDHRVIPIRVVALASYESACRFLHGMDGLPRLYDVARFRLRRPADSGPGDLLRVETELHVYYQPGPTSFAETPRHVR